MALLGGHSVWPSLVAPLCGPPQFKSPSAQLDSVPVGYHPPLKTGLLLCIWTSCIPLYFSAGALVIPLVTMSTAGGIQVRHERRDVVLDFSVVDDHLRGRKYYK